jgi:hypothetical protein
MKYCSKCKSNLELSAFSKNKSRKDGLMPVCKSCNLLRVKTWQIANPDKIKYTYEKQIIRHGLTLDQYATMLAKYDGMCYACQEVTATVIDHDHNCCSGKLSCGTCVRGLLCSNCNTALGLLNDSGRRIISLLDYATREIK